MYNNQDILKKHTALTVSRKDVDTSFIFFPVRLETRFVADYPVEDVSEPDKVLYAFKALWHYVEAIRHGNSPTVLLSRATTLMERVEGLDTVYREDRTRLKDLAAAVVKATEPTGELAKVWDRIRIHIPRLATLDVVSDNEATEFLRKLDRVDRTIRRMVDRPEYNGKLRRQDTSSFSVSAKYKVARKHMKSCLPILEQLLPEDPAKSIVNRFSHITKRQLAKFDRVMKFFEIGLERLNDTYATVHLSAKNQALVREIVFGSKDSPKNTQGLLGDFQQYVKYRDRYLGNVSEKCKSRKQSLHDKMASKVGQYHHYTLFAEKMILWSLRMGTTRRDIATPSRVKIWRELACNTIFSYHEEREWLLQVLATYNDWEANYRGREEFKGKNNWADFDLYHRISPTRLNKNNRFIRNRKLCYRKNAKCLLIRVYPDEVAVTQMARGLSAEEILYARLFWVKYFHANNELEREAAWRSLCDYYAPPRAAFIARKQFPNRLDALKAFKVPGDMTETIKKKGYAYLDCFFPNLVPVSEGGDTFPVPITELMPDRFVVQATLDNGNQKPYTIVQYGRLIPKSLQVGLDVNNAPQVKTDETGLKLGGNLRWMTDYAAAERMGMAITIPLDSYKWFHITRKQKANNKQKGIKYQGTVPRKFLFKSIYVTGMKEFDMDNEKDSRTCSKLLQDVFNAHLYGDEGLELLKIGTPTNILDDKDDNSTFDTGLEAQVKEFYAKSIVPLEKYVNRGRKNGDADLLSHLFGIAQSGAQPKENPFLNTANRENADILKQRVVNKAFLSLTEEQYFFDNQPILKLLNGRLKNFFINDVSPVGVFPSFRIGDQPYGIVPVCDFKNMKFRKGDPLYLVRNLMLYLADKWNGIAKDKVISESNMYQSRASRMTTEERYLQAVGGTPYSSSFYERQWVEDPELLDPAFFDFLNKGSQKPNSEAKTKEEKKAEKEAAKKNANKGIGNDQEDPMHSIRTIVAQLYPSFSQDAMVKKYFPYHDRLSVKDSDTTHPIEEDRMDWGGLRKQILSRISESDKKLFRDADEMNLYITGTFDLFNYRLDAWLTGLLHKRIYDRMQVKKNHKVSLGAYGWVFNLKEDRSEPASDEFIVAPSINQAITGAVLRSSFNRSAEGSTQDYTLNVNLSSSRVRQALRIIDGVRNGLSVGAVLGSDLERALHEEHKKSGLEMDYFIYFLRQAYPLGGSPTERINAETNAGADKGFRDVTIDVLNGSSLLDDLRKRVSDEPDSQKMQLTNLYGSGKKTTWMWLSEIFHQSETDVRKSIARDVNAKVDKLIYLIQEMEDAYDALADVITSESVYKLTQGNREAVDALMNSLQTGRNIPDPEVTEIPLSSAHIEQRVVVALNSQATADTPDSVMQQAEPCLDEWMGRILGFDRLAFPNVSGNTLTYVPLSEIGITPSELVYLSGDWDRFAKFLEVARWFQDRGIEPEKPKKGVPSDGLTRKNLADVAQDPSIIPLDEAEWAVDSMREMLSKARELRQDDLIAATVSPDETLARRAQMNARYDSARAYVAEMAKTMFDLGAPTILDQDGNVVRRGGSAVRHFEENPYLPLPDETVMQMFRLLFQCFRCGVLDAISGVDPQLLLQHVDRFERPTEFAELLQRQVELVKQVGHVSEVLTDRMAKADAIRNDKVDPDGAEAIKQLLLSSFRMICPFRADNNAAVSPEVFEKQKDPKWFGNVDQLVLERTLTDLSDVRTQMNALHQIRMYAQWNGTGAYAEPTAMQIDTAEVDYRDWLGAEALSEAHVHDANVYTVLNASEFMRRHETGGKFLDVAGLVVDFWVEKIPYRRQTAAIAFGYDQPDAEPPQAILVGVSTLGGKHNWSEHRMIRTIRSAMHQVQSRAVEPEHLYADNWTSSLFPVLRINYDSIMNKR